MAASWHTLKLSDRGFAVLTEWRNVDTAFDVGLLIRQKRESVGMTQQELAFRVGTTRQCIIRLEQGRNGVSLNTGLYALEELGLEMIAQLDMPRSR